MIRKIFLIILCSSILSCSGFTTGAGLKLKTGHNYVKIGKEFVSFEDQIGDCGASVVFFGILLPVVPVWFIPNSCKKSFDIDATGIQKLGENAKIKLKYNGVIYDPILIENLTMFYGSKGEYQDEYGKKYRFKIPNFWKFRMADDKALIFNIKTENGQDFTGEIPVKWGIMFHNNWSFP